ncbi:MAG TPA: RNA-binding protein, partial [Rhizomicrobium sp.]|nr:RNA-binding protein [Rhizomicrobium sp.]
PRLLVTVGSLESHPSATLMDDYRRYYTKHPEAIPGETVDQAIKELFADAGGYDKAEDTRLMTERLAKSGVKATFVEFDGEEHMSAAINALNRGIPFALRPAP